MSADPSVESVNGQTVPDTDADEEIREALIAYCRLSSEAVEQIDSAMQSSGLDFTEEALQLGFVTPKEARQAHSWARENIARRNPHVIEQAVRRQINAVTVRHTVMGRPSPRLLPAYDLNNPHSERVRALRTELLLLNDGTREARCLGILSPCAGEGRSQLAAELAIVFSQLGRRTLLVDADLRNPTQHQLFCSDVPWGLGQALAFGEPPHLIGVEGLPFLSVLPAGPRVPNPLELISGGRFESLLKHSRRDYDFIIIDTPPVSHYADALTIAAVANRVLLVGRKQATPYKDVQAMLRRLGPTQTQIIGAVVSTF
jgi:protein-tyrosine kinase